jgi:hypothetical protein
LTRPFDTSTARPTKACGIFRGVVRIPFRSRSLLAGSVPAPGTGAQRSSCRSQPTSLTPRRRLRRNHGPSLHAVTRALPRSTTAAATALRGAESASACLRTGR